MDHDQQTGHGFEAVPDEDGMTAGAADVGDDSDAPIDLEGARASAADETADAFMLISRTTSGDARPVIDWRSALALGGGVALVIALLRRLR